MFFSYWFVVKNGILKFESIFLRYRLNTVDSCCSDDPSQFTIQSTWHKVIYPWEKTLEKIMRLNALILEEEVVDMLNLISGDEAKHWQEHLDSIWGVFCDKCRKFNHKYIRRNIDKILSNALILLSYYWLVIYFPHHLRYFSCTVRWLVYIYKMAWYSLFPNTIVFCCTLSLLQKPARNNLCVVMTNNKRLVYNESMLNRYYFQFLV